jgi:hypothetical protein
MAEKPFTLAIPDDALAELHKKLALSRIPDELDSVGWDYGVPLVDVQRLLARWRDGYEWRVAERTINDALPMFTRPVDVEGHGALEIHYVHKKSDVPGAVPLLFVHGCGFSSEPRRSLLTPKAGPGSFIEVEKILPLLVAPSEADAPAFHVVALSLPGFGFSEAPRQKGFGHVQFAEVRGHSLFHVHR